jgi:hypothetical protein
MVDKVILLDKQFEEVKQQEELHEGPGPKHAEN